MKAALLTTHNAPLTLAEVEPCALAPGQVLVNMLVSGICGKQLGEIAGTYDESAPLPRLLGHEGCGIVEAVGPGVTKVKPADKVCCHWRKSSGMEADFPRYRYSDNEITSGRITTFSEQAIISENRLTKVPIETPNELVTLLGCGLSTALGVMENEAKLKMGESVLIVGCGGVGLNLIRVAKMMNASEIFAQDLNSEKARKVYDLGARSFTNPTKDDILRSMDSMPLSGRLDSFNVIVDTTGSPAAIESVLPLLGSGGRMVLVGQPRAGKVVEIVNARHLFDGEGKTIKSTQGGGFLPDRDMPRYIQMWKSGHLKLDGIITHRYKFAEINEALDAVRSGNAGRAVLEMI